MDGQFPSTRNMQIEGLRGVSIVLIVLYHVVNRYQQLFLDRSIRFMNSWGTFGVTAFFMISAYFAINPNSLECGFVSGIRKWLLKIWRLWPTYLICMTLTFIVTSIAYLPKRTVAFGDYLVNIFLINRFFNVPYVDGAHWYLSILITLFLIIAVLRIFNIHNRPWIYTGWVLGELLIDKADTTGTMYPIGGPFVGSFCIGIALRFLLTRNSREMSDRMGWGIVITFSVISTYLTRGLICALECVVVLPILILCIKEKLPGLSFKPLVFLGNISYSLYLIHQNISYVIQYNISKAMGYSLVCPLIASIIVILMGIGIHFFFEKPVNRRLLYRKKNSI